MRKAIFWDLQGTLGGGRDSLGKYRSLWDGYEADYVAENAIEAVKYIIGK